MEELAGLERGYVNFTHQFVAMATATNTNEANDIIAAAMFAALAIATCVCVRAVRCFQA